MTKAPRCLLPLKVFSALAILSPLLWQEGIKPRKDANSLWLWNLDASPISVRIDIAVTIPIPGMEIKFSYLWVYRDFFDNSRTIRVAFNRFFLNSFTCSSNKSKECLVDDNNFTSFSNQNINGWTNENDCFQNNQDSQSHYCTASALLVIYIPQVAFAESYVT